MGVVEMAVAGVLQLPMKPGLQAHMLLLPRQLALTGQGAVVLQLWSIRATSTARSRHRRLPKPVRINDYKRSKHPTLRTHPQPTFTIITHSITNFSFVQGKQTHSFDTVK